MRMRGPTSHGTLVDPERSPGAPIPVSAHDGEHFLARQSGLLTAALLAGVALAGGLIFKAWTWAPQALLQHNVGWACRFVGLVWMAACALMSLLGVVSGIVPSKNEPGQAVPAQSMAFS
ncbi:MAG: hypothetical protein ACYCW6_18085, partial [Candidatus Xenobia bacterium]